jgi:hypothetical protein
MPSVMFESTQGHDQRARLVMLRTTHARATCAPGDAAEVAAKAAVAARSPPAASELRSRQHAGGAGTNHWEFGTTVIGEHCLSWRRGVAAPKRRRRALAPLRPIAAEPSPRFARAAIRPARFARAILDLPAENPHRSGESPPRSHGSLSSACEIGCATYSAAHS